MARAVDNIHIPLKPKDAIRLLMQVKPDDSMRRPRAAHPAKKKRAKKAK